MGIFGKCSEYYAGSCFAFGIPCHQGLQHVKWLQDVARAIPSTFQSLNPISSPGADLRQRARIGPEPTLHHLSRYMQIQPHSCVSGGGGVGLPSAQNKVRPQYHSSCTCRIWCQGTAPSILEESPCWFFVVVV